MRIRDPTTNLDIDQTTDSRIKWRRFERSELSTSALFFGHNRGRLSSGRHFDERMAEKRVLGT